MAEWVGKEIEDIESWHHEEEDVADGYGKLAQSRERDGPRSWQDALHRRHTRATYRSVALLECDVAAVQSSRSTARLADCRGLGVSVVTFSIFSSFPIAIVAQSFE